LHHDASGQEQQADGCGLCLPRCRAECAGAGSAVEAALQFHPGECRRAVRFRPAGAQLRRHEQIRRSRLAQDQCGPPAVDRPLQSRSGEVTALTLDRAQPLPRGGRGSFGLLISPIIAANLAFFAAPMLLLLVASVASETGLPGFRNWIKFLSDPYYLNAAF